MNLLIPSSVTCKLFSITGAASDSCTVSLTGAASTNMTVSLSSNSTSVTVPKLVTVAKNSSAVTFNVTVAAVSSASMAMLTAAANGGTAGTQLQLNAAIQTLSASASTINFGNVTTGQTATQVLLLSSTGTSPVTISGISVAGSTFAQSGVTTPLTLTPGQTATLTVKFSPQQASAFFGTLSIASTSSQGTIAVNLGGTGVAPTAVSAISCTIGTMSGAGTDACTVTLTAAAPASGLSVALTSNNSVVTIPGSVLVAAGVKSAAFTATVGSFTSSQTATLTGSGGGASGTFLLQLSPAQSKLGLNATSISFGNVIINNTATQSLALTSTGTTSVSVTSATVTGTGFSISGLTFPLTLNVGQTATLNVIFNPSTAGAASGQLTIKSTSSSGATTTLGLSGTGQPHQVQLSWNAPTGSGFTIAGYRIYRANVGSSSYRLLNSTLNAQSSFLDSTGSGKTAYQYYVTAVSSGGVESLPSNTATVSLP